MSSGGIPISSATIWANVVSWPWPCDCTPMPHHRLAGRVHAQLGAVGHAQAEDVHVLARPGADGLGEERDADAHQLAALALLGLLAAQLVVAGHLERLAHRRLVVARVVLPAGLRVVRELLRLQEVLQPQLGRVDVHLCGQQVDHALDQVDRLGHPERARVRDPAGRLVGVDALDLAVRGLEVVRAGEHVEEAGRVLGRLRGRVERAVVGDHVDPDAQDLAVASSRRSRRASRSRARTRCSSGSPCGPPST